MEAVDYSSITLDELVVMDKVDICQVQKYFKEELIKLNDKFIRFKGFSKRLIVGQWVVQLDYVSIDDNYLNITKVKKIAETLEEEYYYTPREVNDFLDNLKKDRMRIKKGYTLVIDGNFSVYDEDNSYFADSLGGSCMNGYAERYYDLHACLANPDDLQIASLWDYENNLVARTLIWKGSFYDRIYANNSALVKYVKTLLNEKGFSSVYYAPMDSVDIPLSKELGDYPVPYMDSVCYYFESPLKISTSSRGYSACLQETDGESCFNRERCACCGDWVSSNTAYYVYRHDEHICPSCSDEVVYATDTEQYEYIDSCTRPVDSTEYYYDVDGLYYTEDTGDYYVDNDDIYFAEDVSEYYANCDSLYYAVDSELYYKNSDDLYFAEDTEEWYESPDELFYDPSRGIYIREICNGNCYRIIKDSWA